MGWFAQIRYPDNHWHDALRIAGKDEMNLKVTR